MAHVTIEGPDFLCIGMPKAGTGWLFDQLKYHPDFWMPPVKELGYLLVEKSRLGRLRNRLKNAKEDSGKVKKFLTWSSRGEDDLRPFQFMEEAASAAREPLDVGRYAHLFRYKEGLLSGDLTTGYCALPPDVIARVGERLPQTKIVLLVREPVERAWSHISMWCRAEVISEETATDPKLLSSFLQTNERFERLGFASRTAATWKDNAPQLEFRTFFYDGIAKDSEEVRREILLFLGADPSKPTIGLDPDFNKKASLKKLALSEGIKAVLVEHFRKELLSCANMFGGPATMWPAKYGLS